MCSPPVKASPLSGRKQREPKVLVQINPIHPRRRRRTDIERTGKNMTKNGAITAIWCAICAAITLSMMTSCTQAQVLAQTEADAKIELAKATARGAVRCAPVIP